MEFIIVYIAVVIATLVFLSLFCDDTEEVLLCAPAALFWPLFYLGLGIVSLCIIVLALVEKITGKEI